MATVRPFAYNIGSPIPDTEQLGNLAIGTFGRDYSGNYGGVRWFMGPDEDLGYVIAHQTAGNDQPTQPGIIPPFGDVGFWRTVGFLDSEFIKLSQFVARITGDPQIFATADDAKTWLNANGYWTSFGLIPVSPTPTPSVTVTPSITTTPNTTPTPTPTSGDETLIDPIITNNDEYIIVGNDLYLMFVDPVGPVPTPTPTPTQTVTPTSSEIPVTPTPTSSEIPVTPTPTLTQTPTPTPTLTQTPTPTTTSSNKSWLITQCGDPCDTGTCACNSSSTLTVYTLPSVTSLVTPGVTVYTDSLLTTTWNGYYYYPDADEVWLFTNGTTSFFNSCSVGLGPCIPVSPTPTNTSTPTPTPTPTQGVSGDFNVTISQVGPDVVWSGSGSFNLAALTSAGSSTIAAGFQAGQAIWAIGPNVPVDTYSGTITYPTTFGSGGVGVTSSSGSTFGVLPGGSGRLLYVPSGYVSNTTISGSATYASQTIAGMGLTSGTYTWSWGLGGNTSTLVMTIG